MMGDGYLLGIDTSNYTTSVAILDASGKLVANLKRPLPVKEGERGLRQSDALFHHTVNLPYLMEEVGKITAGQRLIAVGVSDKPRNVEGSYMPCFLAGVAAAESIRAVSGVPLYRFSHQCGHVMAALFSSGRTDLASTSFAAFHVSGGTTELVRVSGADGGFITELVGGTRDLNAGQVVDRIGVAIGLKFPAGAELEKLALTNTKRLPRRKVSRDGLFLNLSGLENIAIKLYRDTDDRALVAAFVLDYIARALDELSDEYREQYGECEMVYAGGVMSNSIIKKYISERRAALFAEPAMSADNAVGVAMLAYEKCKSEKIF